MEPRRYRIGVRGRLSQRFATAFEGMAIEHDGNGTFLVGDVTDQSQLYGLIDRLRDFGLELQSLREDPR